MLTATLDARHVRFALAEVEQPERQRCPASAPDTFLAGARALGVEPAQAAVFEDALAGVAAGRAGKFGCVVGVDRAGQTDALREHGTDIVVPEVSALLEAP